MNTRIAVLGLALVSSLALAQLDGPPPSGGKSPHMARMENALGLTEEQVKQMREIRDNGGSMAEMHAVLTPEQQAKAAEFRKEHGGDKAERKARLQAALGLSDEQMAKMSEIRKDGGSREEMRAVLTPEQLAKLDEMRAQHGWNGKDAQE